MYAKTCFVTLPPWIWKPSFGSSFRTLSHWFNFSSSSNAQGTPTSGAHQRDTACVSSNLLPSLRQIGTSISSEYGHPAGWTWARMNPILTQRKASSLSDVVTGSEAVYGLTIEQVLTHRLAHMTVWNYSEHSGQGVCALPYCLPPGTPVEEFNGSQTESSGQHGEASHHKDRNRQICVNSSRGSRLIYRFMSIMVTI